MPPRVSPRLEPKALIGATLVALPAILFYAILFQASIDVPFQDDYEALLDFLNQMALRRSFLAKLSYFFAAQFNEYKLFFGHGLAWLQCFLLGHIDIRMLCALGNGFVLLLGALLWKMFLPNHENLAQRIALFIPVSWMLFQLQYVETLNWAMPSLQNLPVLVFSFATIYLLLLDNHEAFFGALAGLTLAVAASGNGLIMIPIGVMILGLGRHYARLVGWLAVATGCIAAYAYRYAIMGSQTHIHHSLISLMRTRPLYIIAFMGSTAALPLSGLNHRLVVLASILLGLLICIFFALVAGRGYLGRNPLISYCVLFVMLTAIGVSGLRGDSGIAHSLDSRYKIYSTLLLIFVWFAIVEEFLQHQSVPLWRNPTFIGAVTGSVLFCLTVDRWGWSYLSVRNHTIVSGMAAYEHPGSPESSPGPILPYPNQDPRLNELDRRAPEILTQSMELGIYRPPAY